MDTIGSAVDEQDSKLTGADVKLAVEHEKILIAEWERKTQQLLNELFTITRDIKVLRRNFEEGLTDLDHQIQLTQLKYQLSTRDMRNYFSNEGDVEMASFTSKYLAPVISLECQTP